MKRTPLKPGNKPLKRTAFKRKPSTLGKSKSGLKPKKPAFSGKKSKKVKYRDRADGLWQELIWHMWNGKCAMCGKRLKYDEFTGEREGAGHHLIRRGIYHFRHNPNNGILLCNNCHNFAENAPHHSSKAFMEWLYEHFPVLWEWKNEHSGVEGVEPDYKYVCEGLITLIKEAKGG